jgi:hypothetical protein
VVVSDFTAAYFQLHCWGAFSKYVVEQEVASVELAIFEQLSANYLTVTGFENVHGVSHQESIVCHHSARWIVDKDPPASYGDAQNSPETLMQGLVDEEALG